MKTRGGVESYLYSLINLGARSELVVSAMPGRFTTNKKPDTHRVGGWLDTSARVWPVQKISPLPGFDPLTVRLVASRYNW